MWALIQIGSKQYKVSEGDVIETERLIPGAYETKNILALVDSDSVSIGTPYVKGASVRGEVVEEIKAPKVIIFKYKRRKSYKRMRGHRQIKSHLKILAVSKS